MGNQLTQQTNNNQPKSKKPRSSMEISLQKRLDTLWANPTKVKEPLRCKICGMVMNDPHRVSCGHSFCKSCCEKYHIDKHKNCPICHKKVNFSKTVKNYLVQNIINDLMVRCDVPDCGKVMKLSEYVKKYQKCRSDYEKAQKSKEKKGLKRGLEDLEAIPIEQGLGFNQKKLKKFKGNGFL